MRNRVESITEVPHSLTSLLITVGSLRQVKSLVVYFIETKSLELPALSDLQTLHAHSLVLCEHLRLSILTFLPVRDVQTSLLLLAIIISIISVLFSYF